MTTSQKPDPLPVVAWKCGNEFAPYHPQASHINPDHRDGWNACYRAAQASLLAKEAECKVLMEALLKIARWELPATGKFWDEEKTRPTSYETEYGSNGARTYMRSLALAAIDAARAAADQGGAS